METTALHCVYLHGHHRPLIMGLQLSASRCMGTSMRNHSIVWACMLQAEILKMPGSMEANKFRRDFLGIPAVNDVRSGKYYWTDWYNGNNNDESLPLKLLNQAPRGNERLLLCPMSYAGTPSRQRISRPSRGWFSG